MSTAGLVRPDTRLATQTLGAPPIMVADALVTGQA